MKKSSIVILLLQLPAAALLAHPGHGTGNPLSPGHYIGNPEHSIPITLALAGGIVVVNWLLYKFLRKIQK
jgi:hypothetical protein